MNINHYDSFISNYEREYIKIYVKELVNVLIKDGFKSNEPNIHIETLLKELRGISLSYDFSKTTISKKIATYQGAEINTIDRLLIDIRNRIVSVLKISSENSFLQIVGSDKDGIVNAHYDASISGYINFKCNIHIAGDDYISTIDNKQLNITTGDLYTFEASLFKHSTSVLTSERIILSYGFLIPYKDLGWLETDPRIRMSERISKYLQ